MPTVRVDPATSSVRLEPVQQRSTRRLEDLLNAAATYIHDNGFETLTTAHVSDIAGSSIGTVYRYFPDRIALLDALAQRNAERAEEKLAAVVSASQPASLHDLVGVAVDALTEMFRHEVGFRAIRLGDPLDIRPAREQRWGVRAYAKAAFATGRGQPSRAMRKRSSSPWMSPRPLSQKLSCKIPRESAPPSLTPLN